MKYRIICILLVATTGQAEQSVIYINQIGSNDAVIISQHNQNNTISGYSTTEMPLYGGNNTLAIHQGESSNSSSANNMMLVDVIGNGGNLLNFNQGTDTNGYGNGLDTGNHVLGIQINGSLNSVTTQQQNTGVASGHYAEVSILGSANTVGIAQTGNSEHTLNLQLVGNGNNAIVDQNNSGSPTANTASISLTNAGGPVGINLTQTGGQAYSVNSVCFNPSGCGTITVRQGN